MKIKSIIAILTILILTGPGRADHHFASDTISTASGKMIITFIGHGTLMIACNNTVIHIDPVSRYAGYEKLAKADIILVTHHHGDHLDAGAIAAIKKTDTTILLTSMCAQQLGEGHILRNGQDYYTQDINIRAVPAYNIVHKRDNGDVFHPRGEGNGYVITWGKKRVYIAGDTENIPEMRELKDIDIAFLPMNLPYTMTPEMAAGAARMIKPAVLYPYHFGDTDISLLVKELKNETGIEIRTRNMQ